MRNERNEQAKGQSETFLKLLSGNGFEGLKLEIREEDENNKNIKFIYNSSGSSLIGLKELGKDGKDDSWDDNISSSKYDDRSEKQNDFDISLTPYYGFEPDKMTLFLHQLPRNVSRLSIIDVLKKQEGFVAMSVSEPIKNQNYVRYVWVTFDGRESCEKAYETLSEIKISGDYKTNPIISKSNNNKKVRVCFPAFEDRIIEDLEFSKQLIKILDKEKLIEVIKF